VIFSLLTVWGLHFGCLLVEITVLKFQIMSSSLNIRLTQPVSLLKKPLEVNGRELFKSVGKAIADGIFQNWNNVSLDLVEVGAALGLGTSEGELAWKLVYSAMAQAILNLVRDNRDLLKLDVTADELLKKELKGLDLSQVDSELVLDPDFFRNPKQSPIVKVMQLWFRQWLEPIVEEPLQAEMMSRRLPAYFLYALHEEWLNRKSDYAALREKLDTPFSPALEQEEGWGLYRAWLQKQVEEPMFLESFGLKQVYVSLAGYYIRKSKQRQSEEEFEPSRTYARDNGERVVVPLEPKLTDWLHKSDRLDAIRLISGGPGSGKSSFTKMWAAKLAEEDSIRVLYIPLHQFNPAIDLVEAVGNFVSNARFLSHNPLDGGLGETRLLIIFDGLDELAMQGKVGSEAAQSFVREVQSKVSQFNSQQTRLQVLMSGRDVVVQASSDTLRQEGQVLYVLPYFVTEEECEEYVDDDQLLKRDGRQQWWYRYGEVSGGGYTKLPEELDRGNLREITAQPLLNYLVALSYTGGRLDFSAQSNLNQIYADLLTAIYERGWAEGRQHPGVGGMSQEQFERVLEEIALSSWHGDGRTTTIQEIERHCDSSGLKKLLDIFQEGAKTGVTRLLTAFYFRQSGSTREGEKTFEFTHKSFGEYLTARRIVRGTGLIYKKLQDKQNDPDEGWDEKEALTTWAYLCGAAVMDEYLFRFIADEVQLRYREKPDLVEQWQQTLCQLIGFMLRYGMPMEKLDPRPNYREESRQARNAEEALLAVLNACASCTEEVSNIQWPSLEAFGAWIARLQGQRTSEENVLALHCLSFLNLQNQILAHRDFYWANLQRANLVGANLQRANLQRANLQGANLQRANLQRANLQGANLQRANLQRANLQRANLQRAYLQGANLQGANLQGADLEGVDLKNISWDKYTQWQGAKNLDKALNIPQEWKR
jgi:hypothetical protein